MTSAAAAEPAAAVQNPELLRITVPWLRLWWLTAVVALLVALDQVSRLFAVVLTDDGSSWGLGEMMGPTALAASDGWRTAFGTGSFRAACLLLYVQLDAVLIALYLAGGVLHVLDRYTGNRRRPFLVGLFLLAAVDGTEDVLAAVASTKVSVAPSLVTALTTVSTAKFLIGTVLALALLWGWRDRLSDAYDDAVRSSTTGQAPPTWRRSSWMLLRQHRLTLIPVAVLGLLLIAPGTGILDQLPDVVRRWATGPGNFAAEGGLGLLALVVLSLALFVLGRARTAQACAEVLTGRSSAAASVRATPTAQTAPPASPTDHRRGAKIRRWWHGPLDRPRGPEGDSSPADLSLWLAGPLGVGLVVLVLRLADQPVSGWRYLLFCAVPVAVVVCSALLQAIGRRSWRRPRAYRWEGQLHRLAVLGDVLSLSVLALGAIGIVRALTPVVVLQLTGQTGGASRRTYEPYAPGVLLAGGLGILVLWPLVGWVYARGRAALGRDGLARDERRWAALVRWLTPSTADPTPGLVTGRLPFAMLLASAGTFVLAGLLPSVVARGGVLAVLVLGILCLTGFTAGAGLVAARHPTAEVFRALRLRSTPVVTLLAAAVVFASLVDARLPIHAVRVVPPTAASARPDLPTVIDTWADAAVDRGCTTRTTVAGAPVDLVPMVLLASEGGGIRAAYWTVATTNRFAATPCARQATVLSSGVSGGAVGLAAVRYDRDPLRVVTGISNSRALGVGLDGLMVRDLAFAGVGAGLPAAGHPGHGAFVDRAALMEDTWGGDAGAAYDWRSATFADPAAVRSDRVGSVVLNSMTVGAACRVWVSEVALPTLGHLAPDDSSGRVRCDAAGAGVRSIDLLGEYQDAAARAGVASCVPALGVTTAALLAARFPYVTPSGRIGPCRQAGGAVQTDQLVDGGYLENTGLGTLDDLSDVWLPAVQRWNAAHDDPRPGAARAILMPMIVYLDNDTATDRRLPQRSLTQEGFLPPLAKLRAGGVADVTTLERAADSVLPDRVCGANDTVCRVALGRPDHRVFVIFPLSQPEVAAPLGWILSDASRTSMDAAVEAQATTTCPRSNHSGTERPECRYGYGSLGDLLRQIDR